MPAPPTLDTAAAATTTCDMSTIPKIVLSEATTGGGATTANDRNTCHVTLWDDTTTVMSATSFEDSLRDALERLCKRRNIQMSSIDAFLLNSSSSSSSSIGAGGGNNSVGDPSVNSALKSELSLDVKMSELGLLLLL